LIFYTFFSPIGYKKIRNIETILLVDKTAIYTPPAPVFPAFFFAFQPSISSKK